jgi:hypothetical protein
MVMSGSRRVNKGFRYQSLVLNFSTAYTDILNSQKRKLGV